jgi:hypothetical protein
MGLGGYDAEESEIRFTISATDLDVPAQTLTFTITPRCFLCPLQDPATLWGHLSPCN